MHSIIYSDGYTIYHNNDNRINISINRDIPEVHRL